MDLKNNTENENKKISQASAYSRQTEKEVLHNLRSSHSGLSSGEADKRLKRYGLNTVAGRKRSLIYRALTQLKNPVVTILLVSGIFLYTIGYVVDAYIILTALAINLVITMLQEGKASRAFELLRSVDKQYAQVLRDGQRAKIPAEKVVPGDIVFFESGNKVPADIRILQQSNLRADESVLTGEWMPVNKEVIALVEERPITERINMLWKGTTVVAGFGCGVVVETGVRTIVGDLTASLYERETKTPLQIQTQRLARWVMMLVLCSVAIIIGIATAQNLPFSDIVVTAIAVAVAGIPSGLPAAITVVLLVGMRSILGNNGLVRNMLAAETLGTTTWILTDKTGTLTNGTMTLSEIIYSDGREEVSDDTISPFGRGVVFHSYLATNGKQMQQDDMADTVISTGSSIEQALVHACTDVCADKPSRQRRIAYLPFESKSRYSAALVRSQSGAVQQFIVGAPEIIIERATATCRKDGKGTRLFTDKDREKMKSILTEEAMAGKRLIAVSSVNPEEMDEAEISKLGEDAYYRNILENHSDDMTFIALLVLEDSVREDVPEAVAAIRQSGVTLTMVTGDNQHTALHIAKKSGIVIAGDSEEVLIGDEVRNLSDDELFAAAGHIRVFARMLPDQKSRLLRVLLERKEVVAMTGDGVNDAPALHRASIGIAVASGTDVAKEASDLILLKNSFTTITTSIIEGKKIIRNLKKVLTYLLSTSFSEAILVAGGLLMTAVLPITPVQILWANIVEEAFIAFAFAFERENDRTVNFNPRNREATNILNRGVRRTIITLSILTGIFLLAAYLFLTTWTSLSQEQIQTVMFLIVSIDSIFLALSLKRFDTNIFKTNIFDNKWLLAAIAISLILLIIAFVTPPIASVLSIAPVPLWVSVVIPISALFHISVIEVVKYLLFTKEEM